MTQRPPITAKAVAIEKHQKASRKNLGLGLLAGLLICAGVTSLKAQDVTVSHGYSNFGELKYGPDMTHLDYVNPDAPKGGEISTWSLGNFNSFNLYARDGVAGALTTIGSESILTSTADDPYGSYCFLCTTLEYPEDLSYVIFNLRDDITFWDGTPLTAEDIAFTNALFLEQGIAEYRRIVEGFLDSVEILGPHKIKFNFNESAPIRDRIGFAGGTPAFSKAWFEETETRLDKASEAPFMSTGPYKLDSFETNRQIIYTRDENYWGEDIPFNVGRNNFDRIRIEYFADRTAGLEAFKAGEYLFRTETDAKEWALGYDFPGVKNGTVKLEELPDQTVGRTLSFVFNLDREPWQDARVRRAISMMFNFEWTNETLFFDKFERPVSFWPRTELAATGTPSEGELAILQPLVDEGLLDANILTDEAYIPAVQNAESNRTARRVLREAGKLLDEAGWEVGDDGMRRRNGEQLELDIIQFNPLYDRVVGPFTQNLEGLGIKTVYERIESAQYVERRRKGDFDMTSHGIQMGFEPSIGLEQWFASKTADNSSRNLMRLRNDAVDKIIPQVVAAQTLDDLKTSVHALDRVLRSLEFIIPQWDKAENWVAYYDIFRHPEALPPLAIGTYDFWWYDEEAAEAMRQSGALR